MSATSALESSPIGRFAISALMGEAWAYPYCNGRSGSDWRSSVGSSSGRFRYGVVEASRPPLPPFTNETAFYEDIPTTGRYATLKEITHPTLVVHGNKDIVVAPINALLLRSILPNAQLIVYSDSSHGAQY